MFTNYADAPRQTLSGLVAVAIVTLGALALDQAHLAAAPPGTVEVGQLTPVGLDRLAQATLPEIVVTASRPVTQDQRYAARTQPRRGAAVAARAGSPQ